MYAALLTIVIEFYEQELTNPNTIYSICKNGKDKAGNPIAGTTCVGKYDKTTKTCGETCTQYVATIDQILDDIKMVKNVLCARARPLSPAPMRSHDVATSPRCQTRALAPNVAVAVPSVSCSLPARSDAVPVHPGCLDGHQRRQRVPLAQEERLRRLKQVEAPAAPLSSLPANHVDSTMRRRGAASQAVLITCVALW